MSFYFGAHASIIDGIIPAAKSIKREGGNIIQIMFYPNFSISDQECREIVDFMNKNRMKIVVHASYMHNMARAWDEYSWWLLELEKEIEIAHKIGAIGVVLHFGKKLDLPLHEAYNNMYTSLLYIHKKTLNIGVPIFLETSTGQGSELCYRLDELSHFYKKLSRSPKKEIRDRFKLCIDTCHIFSAGYDLRTKNQIRLYLETFEELIGLHHIALIHLNDSKVEMGTQVDRHESIGKGFIGLTGLRYLFNYFKKMRVPIILETPSQSYRTEFDLLLE